MPYTSTVLQIQTVPFKNYYILKFNIVKPNFNLSYIFQEGQIVIFIHDCLELRHCTLVSEELSGSNGNFWVQLLPLRSGPARHLPIVGGQLAASTCRGLLTLGGLGPDPPSTGGRRELLQLPKTTCAICTVVKDKQEQFRTQPPHQFQHFDTLRENECILQGKTIILL